MSIVGVGVAVHKIVDEAETLADRVLCGRAERANYNRVCRRRMIAVVICGRVTERGHSEYVRCLLS